jgi:hypothetical protein
LFLLSFFHLFFSLLSLLLLAFLISQQRKDEGRNSLCSMCFFPLLTAYLSCVFCLSFSVFLCSLLSFSAWLPFFFFRFFSLS